MVAKLSTTINKIQSLPNSSNRKIINEFLIYMKGNGSSERHQNNNLNVIIEFSNFFDSDTTFYDINRKEQILSFLDTKIKDSEKDPEKKWITSLAVNPILFINASSSSSTLLPSTTNQTFSHDSSSSAINIMIGESISEGQGKIIGQWNIDSEESQNSATAKIEVSYSGTANIKGIGNV
jgi:hypothetical protein